MIRHLFDTIIVMLTDKEWQYWSIKVLVVKVLQTGARDLKSAVNKAR